MPKRKFDEAQPDQVEAQPMNNYKSPMITRLSDEHVRGLYRSIFRKPDRTASLPTDILSTIFEFFCLSASFATFRAVSKSWHRAASLNRAEMTVVHYSEHVELGSLRNRPGIKYRHQFFFEQQPFVLPSVRTLDVWSWGRLPVLHNVTRVNTKLKFLNALRACLPNLQFIKIDDGSSFDIDSFLAKGNPHVTEVDVGFGAPEIEIGPFPKCLDMHLYGTGPNLGFSPGSLPVAAKLKIQNSGGGRLTVTGNLRHIPSVSVIVWFYHGLGVPCRLLQR